MFCLLNWSFSVSYCDLFFVSIKVYDVFFPADQHPWSVDGSGWYFLVVSKVTSPLKGSDRTYLGRHVAGGTSPGLNLILGGDSSRESRPPEEQTWLLKEKEGFFNESRVSRWGRFFFPED